MHVRAQDPADAMTSHPRPDVDVETCKKPLLGVPTVGVFEPLMCKFVFVRLAWMVCLEETRGYPSAPGTWFAVGVTNRQEREMIPSLWWKE